MARPQGVKNKIPQDVKEIVLFTLKKCGGVKYLEKLALERPADFAGLLKSFIPH
jgi:hypothetical protein